MTSINQRRIETGEAVIEYFSGGKHLLSFSAGKDALACWVALRGKVDVVPYYMELIPRLEFVEVSLNYYERFFGVEILRVPNPNLYKMLSDCVYQPPERQEWLETFGVPSFDHKVVTDFICESVGLSADKTFCAVGNRAADNITRRAMFKKHGGVSWNTQKMYPVFDWKIDRVISALKSAGVKLPFDYRIFGRSFDGIDFRFLAPIKKHFPRDYAKILDWFPFVDMEIFRYEKRRV
jgi:hypothetical protein